MKRTTTEYKKALKGATELKKQFERITGATPFKFKQITDNGVGFIYEVNDGGLIHYEVFEKRAGRKYNDEGFSILYPTANAFGLWAFTARSLNRANEILMNKIKPLKTA